jgi:crotonobetainyl-CoA:carnitine CoA-transferase CaiB-like acyl-CoA transferase
VKTDTSAAKSAPVRRPLENIRVVDLTINILGPIATQVLGDMGADVIKVESPEGDFMRAVGPSRSKGMGAFFLNINRNKRGVLLNLKDPASKNVLWKLIETGDVFVHTMRPGAAKRLGIDYESVRRIKPDIVYASASGFRQDSDRSERPAYDDVIQGMSGIADLFRLRSGAPEYTPMMIADKVCGMQLAISLAMAILHKERTGEGQEVHVPMYDTMVSFNLVDHFWNGVLAEPEKGLGYQRALTPLRRPYATKDGHIALMASTDAHWAAIFPLMGRPELVGDPRYAKAVDRVPNLAELYGLIAEKLKERTTAEWAREFDRHQIPNGPINTLQDLVNDPYFAEGHFFRHGQHHSEGPIVSVANPTRYSVSPAVYERAAPRLGEHTSEVLSELNYSKVEIASIIEKARPSSH